MCVCVCVYMLIICKSTVFLSFPYTCMCLPLHFLLAFSIFLYDCFEVTYPQCLPTDDVSVGCAQKPTAANQVFAAPWHRFERMQAPKKSMLHKQVFFFFWTDYHWRPLPSKQKICIKKAACTSCVVSASSAGWVQLHTYPAVRCHPAMLLFLSTPS